MIFCRCFFVFTITIGWFRGRARGVLEIFPACPRADSALQMLGFGVARGVFWARFQVEGTAGSAVKGGDPTPTYLPVHSPRSEGSSVCVCVCARA